MWRLLATTLLLVGCNELFGIHEIVVPDAVVDPCTGVCECKIDSDCSGAHTVCVDETTSRTCTCAAGYAKGTDGCAWSGVVEDPGFLRSDTWVATGVATPEPTAPQDMGMVDPGRVVLALDDACGNAGQVTQQIRMPRRSRAEPLVLRATYEVDDDNRLGGGGAPLLGLGPIWNSDQLVRSESFATSQICLGAAQYAPESTTGPGSEVSLAFSLAAPLAPVDRCDPNKPQHILDHIEIVPALPTDACPEPGQVVNGDAQSGDVGWTFDASAASTSAAFVEGAGANGSRGVRVRVSVRCDRAAASLPISVPLADASFTPALSLYHTSTGTGASLSLDQVALPLSGNGSATVDRYCIPAPLRGGTFVLTASVFNGGTCGQLAPGTLTVDDVAIVDDPLCGGDPGVANPGFESGNALITLVASSTSSATAGADSQAHSGQRDLRLAVSNTCGGARYATPVATPQVTTGEGAAVTFWYKASAGTGAALRTSPHYKSSDFAATRDDQWHQGVSCLDPRRPGFPQLFSIGLETGTSCGALATETATIDDLAVISTPLCPP